MKATYRGNNILNIRSGATTASKVVGTLRRGESVDVKAVHNGWATTDAGYIMACKLDIDAPTEDEERAELESMKVAELRVIAIERGIKLTQAMKKADIIEALLNGER